MDRQDLEAQAMATFKSHVDAFQKADLDAVVKDFDEDATVITPDGVFRGHDGVREVYKGLLDEIGSTVNGDSPGLKSGFLYQYGDTIVFNWHGESKNLLFSFGTDTIRINPENGLILTQSVIYAEPTPKK